MGNGWAKENRKWNNGKSRGTRAWCVDKTSLDWIAWHQVKAKRHTNLRT